MNGPFYDSSKSWSTIAKFGWLACLHRGSSVCVPPPSKVRVAEVDSERVIILSAIFGGVTQYLALLRNSTKLIKG